MGHTCDAKKIYVGTAGLGVLINTCTDLTNATTVSIKVKKPNGVTATWVAEKITIDGNMTYVKHTTSEEDIDIPGVYELQAYAEIGTWAGRGKTVSLVVYNDFT